jgi:hypothetical protein
MKSKRSSKVVGKAEQSQWFRILVKRLLRRRWVLSALIFILKIISYWNDV